MDTVWLAYFEKDDQREILGIYKNSDAACKAVAEIYPRERYPEARWMFYANMPTKVWAYWLEGDTDDPETPAVFVEEWVPLE